MKIGSCKYGDKCGKYHSYPKSGKIVLFKNMYDGLGLQVVMDEESDDHLQVTILLPVTLI